MEAIKTVDLTKRFDSTVAVDSVSFTVEQEEIFGLLGPNGAGKTTIIKMLATLLSPTEGSAFVWNHNILKERYLVRRSIGMVFQDTAVDDRLTGLENLDFHARMYGMEKRLRKKRIDEVLELVGLDKKADILMKNYSGGMKRRLEIARGLMHYPKVLFLDEPTLGLDPQTRFHIWEYIRKLNKDEDITIILTTHYMEEADDLCHRIGIIDYGKILTIDSPDALKNRLANDIISIKTKETERLLKTLSEKPWLNRVEALDGTILINASNGEEKIPLAVHSAQEAGVSIFSISMRKPTLDDVFLHFTGKTIRQEENASSGFDRRGRRRH